MAAFSIPRHSHSFLAVCGTTNLYRWSLNTPSFHTLAAAVLRVAERTEEARRPDGEIPREATESRHEGPKTDSGICL